jgi:xanthine dehydrogenase iron-sulfur cluster and FAD-binding subunit A
MAAEVTCTEETLGVIKKITWAWTAHTDGKVAAATANAETTKTYNGEIVRLVTVPGTGGDQPDDNYTVKIYDDDDVDVLLAAATSNRDETNTEQIAASSLGVVANDKLTLYVEGAGSGHKGTVHLYIR